MFDEKSLGEILKSERVGKKRTGLYLAVKLCTKLRKAEKKLVKTGEKSSDNEVKTWIRENFDRVAEQVKILKKDLVKAPELEGVGKLPRFFKVFYDYLESNPENDEKSLEEVFDRINESRRKIDLSDALYFKILFESALCMRILESFEMADEKYIRKLFFTLDELSFLTQERIIQKNAVEKILCRDPAKLYEKLTDETKNMYRHNLIRIAKRQKKSQSEMAESIVNICEKSDGDDRHIGFFLCDKEEHGHGYIVLLFSLSFVFTLLLCLISPVFVLSFLAVYNCTKLLLEKFFVRFFVKSFHLPEIKLEEIPDKNGVMVVITTLLTGSENDERVFENLEKMYFSNGGKNVYFALLCDLGDSYEKISDKDRDIIAKANERINKLRKKYGGVFFLFLRERDYSKSEGKYIAPERKRGAVGALVNFLCAKSDVFSSGSIKPDEKICNNVRFCFTLDSDTNLAFDCLKKMTGIMLHPQNKPCVNKQSACVTKGYGILQPSMSTTLDSAMKTAFSRVMCGHGGIDVYTSGGSDTNMSLFGQSIFCGKGMFDKTTFYDTLCEDNDFRNETVLSHDAPEGARLRCAFVPDVTLTDSFPKEELSYFKRKHRWIRGDVQNVPFLFPTAENVYGVKKENGISIFAKFFMLENVIHALTPVLSLLCVFVSVLCSRDTAVLLITVTFAQYILPFVYSVMSVSKRAIWQNARRLFFSEGIYTGMWTNFLLSVFRIVSLPKSFEVSVDAVSRSIYRMNVSKRNLLEWMTSAQSDEEKNDGILGYVKKNLFSAFCGCFLFVVSDVGFVKLVSLMWLFLPLFCHETAKEDNGKTVLCNRTHQKLLKYTEDMWQYFEDNTDENTNILPPDNVSSLSGNKVCRMTSPTNIGLYILSTVVARKLGFIGTKSMEKRLLRIVETVEKLPKYKCLLYNWYDIYKNEPLKPLYVSTVDLGNYSVCLKSAVGGLYEFLCEMENDSVIKRIDDLIKECDLSLLYDEKRNLFCIGGEYKNGEFHMDRHRYDMLMSEARLASFTAVSERRISVKHLSALSRRFVEGKGYMGLCSWSGTTFEFFMPEIFIESKRGSLLYEAMMFCLKSQKEAFAKSDKGKVFGISESCYNELDDAGNYKYHAFGVPKTALNVFDFEKVISPYSSFLFMQMDVDGCMHNLSVLEDMGMYGKYGFYESADFERHDSGEDYSVVSCFMAHHIGMSICAAANVLCDGVIRRWLKRDKAFSTAIELADEKIPYNSYVGKIARYQRQAFSTRKEDVSFSDTKKHKETAVRKEVSKSDFFLISANKFQSFVFSKSMGFSFLKDEEVSGVTDYNEGDNPFAEVLGIGMSEADLCAQSSDFFCSGTYARYQGEYKKCQYKADVFIPPGESMKIIRIFTRCKDSFSYTVFPSKNFSGRKEVSGGMVFFEGKNQTAFLYGADKSTNVGARYEISNGVSALLSGDGEYDGVRELVFVLGVAKNKDDACRMSSLALNETQTLFDASCRMNENFRFDLKQAHDKVSECISFYKIPDSGVCTGCYAVSDSETKSFYALLLVYTKSGYFKEYFVENLESMGENALSKAMSAMAFCEYLRLSSDKDFSDFSYGNTNVYRYILSSLDDAVMEVGRDEKSKKMLICAHILMAEICSTLSDLRTSVMLYDRALEIQGENDGIFM